MEKLKTLTISRNVDTPLKFDLTNFIFPAGSKLVWTVKLTEGAPELFIREFTSSSEIEVIITPIEGNLLTEEKYCYDIVLVLADGTLLKQCLISDIVTEGVLYESNN